MSHAHKKPGNTNDGFKRQSARRARPRRRAVQGGQFAEVGTVTGVAFPLVEVDTGGNTIRYRHIDSIQLT